MKPRLYSKSHSWKYNGYGFFNKCKKCQVSEETNGSYTLEMEVLPRDRLYDYLEPGLLIRAKANHKDPTQFFEINNVENNKQGIATVTANHIKSYFWNNMLWRNVPTETGLSGTANEIKNMILFGSFIRRNWKDSSEVLHNYDSILTLHGFDNTTGEVSMNIASPLKYEDLFLGKDGFIETFGGEFKYNNMQVHLYKNRGSLKPVFLHYGSGLSDNNQSITSDNVYDTIIAFAKVNGDDDKEYHVAAKSILYPDNIGENDFFQRAYIDDCTSDFTASGYKYATDYRQLTPEALERVIDTLSSIAYRYGTKNATELTFPKLNIKITAQSQLSKLQQVGLCDSVKIACGQQGTVVTAKANKVVYDSLREIYVEHTFGEPKISLKDLIR